MSRFGERVRRILRRVWPAAPESVRVIQDARHGRLGPVALDEWGEPVPPPGITPKRPNEDLAYAIDALAAQVPRNLRCDLLTLSSDTVRVSLHGFGRSIDVMRPPGHECCDVTVYTLPVGKPDRPVEPHTTTHADVALDHLGALLAQPLPGSTNLLFIPLATGRPGS
jgi:hypothetical protein